MQNAISCSRRQSLLACTSRPRGRLLVVQVHARRTSSDPSPDILTAFFYGRALAVTLNRRVSEALIDVVSDVSKAIAERPQRIAEFQDEVIALARKEMSSSGFLPEETSANSAAGGSPSSGNSSGSSSGGPGSAAITDPQAAIDDLRAEIAYARASLNEIRAAQKASASQN